MWTVPCNISSCQNCEIFMFSNTVAPSCSSYGPEVEQKAAGTSSSSSCHETTELGGVAVYSLVNLRLLLLKAQEECPDARCDNHVMKNSIWKRSVLQAACNYMAIGLCDRPAGFLNIASTMNWTKRSLAYTWIKKFYSRITTPSSYGTNGEEKKVHIYIFIITHTNTTNPI